ncbi:MAG: Glycine cleavage H-protein [Myxococcaceae bacterium]|nr:Glycine cleavage H-protein [Myxococcaceae bacterium]
MKPVTPHPPSPPVGVAPGAVPDDRRYTPDHLWALDDGAAVRVGVTPWFAAAVRTEVTALHLPAIGVHLRTAAPAGSFETAKAALDLFAPCDGEVLQHNPDALADPARCLRDPWNTWLWRMSAAPNAPLWSAARYRALVEARP